MSRKEKRKKKKENILSVVTEKIKAGCDRGGSIFVLSKMKKEGEGGYTGPPKEYFQNLLSEYPMTHFYNQKTPLVQRFTKKHGPPRLNFRLLCILWFEEKVFFFRCHTRKESCSEAELRIWRIKKFKFL